MLKFYSENIIKIDDSLFSYFHIYIFYAKYDFRK
jgi:hypothetical protein